MKLKAMLRYSSAEALSEFGIRLLIRFQAPSQSPFSPT